MAITLNTDLSKLIREECGENVYVCYQCERCSSGCPTAMAMKIHTVRNRSRTFIFFEIPRSAVIDTPLLPSHRPW